MAKGFVRNGYEVTLLSVDNTSERNDEFIGGIRVKRLGLKRLFNVDFLADISCCDYLVWSASPLTVLLAPKLRRLNKPLILLYTGPFYSLGEVARAHSQGVPFRQLAPHYKNAAIPLRLTASMINCNFVRHVVVLSNNNASVLKRNGCKINKIAIIPPGKDAIEVEGLEEIGRTRAKNDLNLPVHSKIITYLGSLQEIRGVGVLMEAFAKASEGIDGLLLLLLARTDKRDETDRWLRKAAALGIKDKMIIVSGVLARHQLYKYIFSSDIIVVPFVLVQSDVPIATIESLAFSKPVITTRVDGMPDLVGDGGLVVAPGKPSPLAEAICLLIQDEKLHATLSKRSMVLATERLSWGQTSQGFIKVVENHVCA
jgi:glycosyltransferase involved in cell wall biosynthesis